MSSLMAGGAAKVAEALPPAFLAENTVRVADNLVIHGLLNLIAAEARGIGTYLKNTPFFNTGRYPSESVRILPPDRLPPRRAGFQTLRKF